MVFSIAENIISPLGTTLAENFAQAESGLSGVKLYDDICFSKQPIYLAAIPQLSANEVYTRFEQICIASIRQALSMCALQPSGKDCLFILSTTKGNVEVLEQNLWSKEIAVRVSLYSSAEKVACEVGFTVAPLVVSNACISGVMAIVIAQRMLQAGIYKHAVICGADVLSHFVVSGFQALQAVSAGVCRPFDAARDGINLGEAAATLVLTTDESLLNENAISFLNGCISNDANHISGPSRTGDELAHAVSRAMGLSHVTANDIAFISAHGTATVYNDEMESKAFHKAGLGAVPLHSLKGYFGHTLGAAGVVETLMSMQMLRAGKVLASKNFEKSGTSMPLQVIRENRPINKKYALKTASGFGGCNAAFVMRK